MDREGASEWSCFKWTMVLNFIVLVIRKKIPICDFFPILCLLFSPHLTDAKLKFDYNMKFVLQTQMLCSIQIFTETNVTTSRFFSSLSLWLFLSAILFSSTTWKFIITIRWRIKRYNNNNNKLSFKCIKWSLINEHQSNTNECTNKWAKQMNYLFPLDWTVLSYHVDFVSSLMYSIHCLSILFNWKVTGCHLMGYKNATGICSKYLSSHFGNGNFISSCRKIDVKNKITIPCMYVCMSCMFSVENW